MLCERNGVHLADVETFPFFEPSIAPDPEEAAGVVEWVSAHLDEIARLDELEQAPRYTALYGELDDAIFAYFGLSQDERTLVRETVSLLMPSIRPRSFKSLDTPAQHIVKAEDFDIYAQALAQSLTDWRKRMGGRGSFRVEIAASDPSRAGPSGIVRVLFSSDEDRSAEIDTKVSDELVLETLAQLRSSGLRALPSGDFLTLVPDALLWVDRALYLVRPLTRRSWTVRQAMRDAERIVRDVQARAEQGKQSVKA